MTLNEWLQEVATALDLEPIQPGPLLDLARDVAHGVARPGAPLTCYLVGVAVGRGIALDQALSTVLGLLPPESEPEVEAAR